MKMSGKYGFNIILDLLNDFELLFIKQDYYNTSDYIYFFTTEKINNKQELINKLKRKKSLEVSYKTLLKLKDLRLSFYFGIKKNICYYGFYDENNYNVYKVGKFKITNSILKSFYKYKSMKTIRDILINNNIKNLNLLQDIKVDFHTLFDNVKSDIEILDEFRIKNTIAADIFNSEDLDEHKLRIYLLQWSRNFKWSDKCHYYINLTNKYIHFYIKIKTQI